MRPQKRLVIYCFLFVSLIFVLKYKYHHENVQERAIAEVIDKSAWCCPKYKDFNGYLKLPREKEDIEKVVLNDLDPLNINDYECKPRRNVAIIVPYRDREPQLRVFLRHMHPILQKQKLNYTIFVIEQAGQLNFNRAKLLNVGFQEARKAGKFDCFIFNDVSMLMQNDKCLLCESTNTRHFSTMVRQTLYTPRVYHKLLCNDTSYKVSVVHQKHQSTFNNPVHASDGTFYRVVPKYLLPSYFKIWILPVRSSDLDYMDGVLRTNEKDMLLANGYSNEYWDMGPEGYDMFIRFRQKGIKVELSTVHATHCTYERMEPYTDVKKDITKSFLFKMAAIRTNVDGLNNLKYSINSYTVERLYTNITVDIGPPNELLESPDKVAEISKGSDCRKIEDWFKTQVFV